LITRFARSLLSSASSSSKNTGSVCLPRTWRIDASVASLVRSCSPSSSHCSSLLSSVDLPVALSPVTHTCDRQSIAPPNGAWAMKPSSR
jgi:hypothetical protein